MKLHGAEIVSVLSGSCCDLRLNMHLLKIERMFYNINYLKM